MAHWWFGDLHSVAHVLLLVQVWIWGGCYFSKNLIKFLSPTDLRQIKITRSFVCFLYLIKPVMWNLSEKTSSSLSCIILVSCLCRSCWIPDSVISSNRSFLSFLFFLNLINRSYVSLFAVIGKCIFSSLPRTVVCYGYPCGLKRIY